MNRVSPFALAFLLCWLCAVNLWSGPLEIEKARHRGAQGQVTLRVVDSVGKPVEKALISVAFWGSDLAADAVVSEGLTDSNGLFVAAGKTIDRMNYTVSKDDYYTTAGKYWFYRPSGLDASRGSIANPSSGEYWLYHQQENSVRSGRWQPWNPMLTLVLKERRRAIPMYARSVDEAIPVSESPVGFDLEVGDWVEPHGAGKRADLSFTYKTNARDFWTGSYELSIECVGRMDGLIRAQNDMWSDFRSVYEAPTEGYTAHVDLALEMTKDTFLKKELFGADENLVLRVRTMFDEQGTIISARYGKIYGPIEFGRIGNFDEGRGGVRFTYYLNPNPNDRNVEFDPERNLFTDLKSSEEVWMP